MYIKNKKQPTINISPKMWDDIKTTTCYMCACRCGIKTYLKNGKIIYIEGNRDHPVNKGVLCAKGSAGIMQHYSPARLQKPLIRTGPRGSGEFREIEWEDALKTATMWLSEIRNQDPKKLAFFTGRDQSQALTGWWAQQFGTPNYAAHGGFCSVNMAAAGLYSFGGSFWEFGEPDWQYTKYFILFGVAEDHASNPIKIGIGKLKQKGAKILSVNPVKTGYSAVADEWIGIKPGTDGMFIAALIHQILISGNIDAHYLATTTNAAHLIIDEPNTEQDGLFAKDTQGNYLVIEQKSGKITPIGEKHIIPKLGAEIILPDGRKAVTVFKKIAQRFLDPQYRPENAAAITGISIKTIKRIAAEIAHTAFNQTVEIKQKWTDIYGNIHEKIIGRPVSMHAMRGISAHSNGFHTCRMIHLLQILLGTIDCPGGFRFKPPYPKSVPPPVKPHGKPEHIKPNKPMPGPPLGFTQGPEDLLIEKDGTPQRIDHAYSWTAPLSAHGLMHRLIANAANHDPYPIDALFLYMANMAWNSAMNTPATIEALTAINEETGEYKIPKIIYADAFYSETVAYADLILPDTTYLERWDCISLLDRPISEPDAVCDAIRQPVEKPKRDVRPFQDVLLDLGARLGLPGMIDQNAKPKFPAGYPDYITHHMRSETIGSLAGWRGKNGDQYGQGEVNPNQLQKYIDNGCFWKYDIPENARYFKNINRHYLKWAQNMGFTDDNPILFQLYSEPLQKFRNAAKGYGDIQPPENLKSQVYAFCDPIPFWSTTFEDAFTDTQKFSFHAITQRPMAMYHSWGSQNAWLRQIHGQNFIYINTERAHEMDIKDEDWVKITSPHGAIIAQVKTMQGVQKDTIWTWNAIGKRAGSWGLEKNISETKKGFLLNHLIGEVLPNKDVAKINNSDPITGQAAWYDTRVAIEKIIHHEMITQPQFPKLKTPPNMPLKPKILKIGKTQ